MVPLSLETPPGLLELGFTQYSSLKEFYSVAQEAKNHFKKILQMHAKKIGSP